MSPEVWKYTLAPGQNRVSMPVGAEPLTAQVQRGFVVMWALVDPRTGYSARHFYVAMTGEPLPSPRKYIATVQVEHIVCHVFEITE